MNIIRVLIALSAIAFASGCATGAKTENMVVAVPVDQTSEYAENLVNQISIEGVYGGEKTSPLWTSEIDNVAYGEALKQSLVARGLFTDSGQYSLLVNLLEVKQPIIGISMTVTTTVRYRLTDSKSEVELLDETLVVPFTAKISDAFAGAKRLRLANEGSAKANISAFLDKLAELEL